MDLLNDRLLRTDDVLAIIPWSRMHLWRQVKAGNFPQPIRLGSQSPAWYESEVREWIAGRERIAYGANSVAAR